MTIFAVMCAGALPAHPHGTALDRLLGVALPERARAAVGRTSASPLLWDVFAINTYLTISLVFWYLGMIPDLATLRDRARGEGQAVPVRPLQPGLERLASDLVALRDDGS